MWVLLHVYKGMGRGRGGSAPHDRRERRAGREGRTLKGGKAVRTAGTDRTEVREGGREVGREGEILRHS